MKTEKPSVVLDANVVFAGLYSRRGASHQVLSHLGAGLFDIHLSVPVVLEYEELLRREKETLGLTADDISAVLDYMCSVATLHEIYFLWRPVLRDPDDEMVLELAVSAGCSHIVTYNQQDFTGAEAFDIELITSKELLQKTGVLS